MAGAMRRKEAYRWAAQPPRAIERTDRLPTPPTTRANPPGERSPAAPRRTSPSEAQAEAGRTALGALLGDKASAEGGLATGQPKCNDRATRCETPLLERPRPRVHSAHAAGLWPAPSGQRPEESGAVNPRQAWPSSRLRRVRPGSFTSEHRCHVQPRSPIAHARGHRRTLRVPMGSGRRRCRCGAQGGREQGDCDPA